MFRSLADYKICNNEKYLFCKNVGFVIILKLKNKFISIIFKVQEYFLLFSSIIITCFVIIVALLLFLNCLVNNSSRITKSLKRKDQQDIEMQAVPIFESRITQTEDPNKLPVIIEEPSTSFENK